MPVKISLKGLKPEEVEIESEPESISLAAIKPDEIEVEHEVRPRRELSPVESGISGLAQGLTFGFSDEIGGAGRAAVGLFSDPSPLGDLVTGDLKPIRDLYVKYRDEQRAHIDAAKVDNPKTFLGANIGGATATGIALPAATVPRAIGQGALTGLGMSEGDLTRVKPSDVKQVAKDVALGGALAGGTQFGLSKLGDAFSKLNPKNLRAYAEERAVKAAGGMKKDFKDLQKSGQLHAIGRDLLDKKIVTLFSSLDEVAEKSGELKDAAGKKMGEILNGADDLVAEAKKMIDEGKLLGFLPDSKQVAKVGVSAPTKEQAKAYIDDTFQASMKRIGERIRNDLIVPNEGEPALKASMKKLNDLADDYAALPSRKLAAANRTKSIVGKLTQFSSDTVPAEFQKQVYRIIKEEVDDTIGKIGNLEAAMAREGVSIDDFLKAKLPNLSPNDRNSLISESFKKAKQEFATGEKVSEMAVNRNSALQSNRGVSLTDTIAAGAGVASGVGLAESAVKGVALGALNKFGRQYGASFQAIGADKLAQVLAKAPNSLGKFGQMIEDAAKNGPIPLIVTHRALMKDPDYQRILLNFETKERGLRLPEQRKGLSLPRGQ